VPVGSALREPEPETGPDVGEEKPEVKLVPRA
jgi:hypothetical protein